MAIIKFILSITFIYTLILATLYVQQRALMYYPYTFVTFDDVGPIPDHVEIHQSEGLEWPVIRSPNPKQKTLILFHGNAGSALYRLDKAKAWINEGYDVVLAEYPGFGTNIGQAITEQSLYAAARITLDHTKIQFPGHDIYLYGESLGSGIAVQMATEYDIAGLIIEAGFSSMVDVAKSRYWFAPVNLLLKDRYESYQKMAKITAPYLHIHGKKDGTVPFWTGEKLYNAHPGPKDMIALDTADHGDIFGYIDMQSVINTLEKI